MSHLSLETIARLVDDTPSIEEAEHLEACEACRTELDGMREDIQALSILPDMAVVPDRWDALEPRLIEEGIIRLEAHGFGFGGARAGTRAAGIRVGGMRAMQIAAALTLFVGGSVAGRLTMRPELSSPAPAPVVQSTDEGDASRAGSVGVLAADETPVVPHVEAPIAAPPARAGSGVTLASDVGRGPRVPTNVEEAAIWVRETEVLYLDALTRFAELASNSEPGDLVARLAALQSIIVTTQAALGEMPTDPVINGYHLTALAQRDATLRQVAAASTERWY